MLEQARRVDDNILAYNIKNTSFFNKNLDVETVNKYVERAYIEAKNKGFKGDKYFTTINGETIELRINVDGSLKTAFGKYKYTVGDFRKEQ